MERRTEAKTWEKDPQAQQELLRLLEKNTEYKEDGFSVSLEEDAAAWDRAIRQLGRKRAYALMGEQLCREFAERNGEEFLFDSKCVAFELEFHMDIYFRTAGYRGYPLQPASLAFSREALLTHTKVVDISTSDVKDLRQRMMFRYRQGVRKPYRGTPKDPFKRRGRL